MTGPHPSPPESGRGEISADTARPERLHPLALLGGLGRAARNVLGGIAAGGYFAFQGRVELAVLVLGGIAIASTIGMLLHWRSFSFRVGSDAIRIDSGILSRNQRTIPFDRVADVSIAQGPLQRVFGIARVTLETGGSAGGQEEGLLDGVALHRAEALREFVRARRGIASAVETPAFAGTTVEESALFAMDVRRVLTLGLFNFSLALFAGLFGASQTVGDLFNIDPFERSFWDPILRQSGWGEWLLAHRLGLAVGGLVVLVVAGVVTGVVRTVLREFGFRLDRTGNGFRRRRGLLTKTDVSLPLRRIQAGLITTGPIRDRLGWRAFKVLSLAGEGGKPGENGPDNHVLAPLATEAEVMPLAGEVGLAMPGNNTDWRPVSKAHVWSYVAVLAPIMLLVAIGTGTSLLLLLMSEAEARDFTTRSTGELALGSYGLSLGLAGVGLALLAGLRWLCWRRTAYALAEGQLTIRTGWWQRRTLLLPLARVQSVTLQENILSRRFGIATLAIDIAGGRAGGQIVPSLPRDQASLLRAELLSRQP